MSPVTLCDTVYDELRRLAASKLAHEPSGSTLDATALVHEAFLRLGIDQSFENTRHFHAAAAEAMRRILIDRARERNALKRGGARRRELVDPDHLPTADADDVLLTLDEALTAFAAAYPQKADLVKLRYFGGLTADQAAELLGMSPSAADRAWVFAKAWLAREIRRIG